MVNTRQAERFVEVLEESRRPLAERIEALERILNTGDTNLAGGARKLLERKLEELKQKQRVGLGAK